MSLALLEQDIPGLAARVRTLSTTELRALARAAAQLALYVSPVDDRRLEIGWAALASDSQTLRRDASEQLQQLVDELDDVAARLQVQLDPLQEQGEAPERLAVLAAGYDREFGQARARETLLAALEPILDQAVAGALYETNAALDHAPAAISALVDAVADGVPDPAQMVVRQLRL